MNKKWIFCPAILLSIIILYSFESCFHKKDYAIKEPEEFAQKLAKTFLDANFDESIKYSYCTDDVAALSNDFNDLEALGDFFDDYFDLDEWKYYSNEERKNKSTVILEKVNQEVKEKLIDLYQKILHDGKNESQIKNADIRNIIVDKSFEDSFLYYDIDVQLSINNETYSLSIEAIKLPDRIVGSVNNINSPSDDYERAIQDSVRMADSLAMVEFAQRSVLDSIRIADSLALLDSKSANSYITKKDQQKVKKNCIILLENEPLNHGNYASWQIDNSLRPRVPISINISFTLNDLKGCNFLFRYGDYGIASQLSVNDGVIAGDFREGKVGDRNGGAVKILGNRSFEAKITPGYHEIQLTYNGTEGQLWVDGRLCDRIYGSVDISKYDGNIWVGRNGFATYPFYFKGKIHKVEICF